MRENWKHFRSRKCLRSLSLACWIKFLHSERKEFDIFLELFKLVPLLEERLMSSSEEDIIAIAEMVGLLVLRSA